MAQNVIINGVTYQNVPEVDIPKSGGGSAKFMDTTISKRSCRRFHPVRQEGVCQRLGDHRQHHVQVSGDL